MTYDPDTKKIKMSVAYDPFLSPIGILGAVLAIIALIGGLFVVAPFVLGIWRSYVDIEIEKERAKQREAEKTTIETITEAIEKGIISKEAGEEAIKNITEAMRHARESTPPTLLERVAMPLATGVAGAGVGALVGWAVARPR